MQIDSGRKLYRLSYHYHRPRHSVLVDKLCEGHARITMRCRGERATAPITAHRQALRTTHCISSGGTSEKSNWLRKSSELPSSTRAGGSPPITTTLRPAAFASSITRALNASNVSSTGRSHSRPPPSAHLGDPGKTRLRLGFAIARPCFHQLSALLQGVGGLTLVISNAWPKPYRLLPARHSAAVPAGRRR